MKRPTWRGIDTRWKTEGNILPRLGTALAALALLTAGGALSAASAAGPETVTWGYFPGGISSPGAVIATQPALKDTIPGNLKFIQINSGVAALAAMRAGSFDVVEGVGNPPVVGALAAHTQLVVVFAESYDGAGLYVNTKMRAGTPPAAAGQWTPPQAALRDAGQGAPADLRRLRHPRRGDAGGLQAVSGEFAAARILPFQAYRCGSISAALRTRTTRSRAAASPPCPP